MNGFELASSIFGVGEMGALGTNEHAAELCVGHTTVAHVGMSERIIVLDGREVKIAGIGYVCTAAEFRGRGYMHTLMEIAHDQARSLGHVYAMLWTGHVGLYEPLGYRHPPNLNETWYIKELGDEGWPDSAVVNLQGTW